MKPQTTETKYLDVLRNLAERKRGFRDIRKILSELKVSVAIQKTLTDKNLIVKDDNGIWRWCGRTPDLRMASDVLHTVNTRIRMCQKSKRAEKSKTSSHIEARSAKEIKNEKAINKYFNFLNFLSERKRGFKSFGKIITKMKMCSSVSAILRKNNLMERRGGTWRWVGKTPDMVMAENILNDVNRSINNYVASKERRENNALGRIKNNALKRIIKGNSETIINDKSINDISVKSSGNILNLSKLRKQRDELQSKIEKINALLEIAGEFQNN